MAVIGKEVFALRQATLTSSFLRVLLGINTDMKMGGMEKGTKQISRSWLPILSEMFHVKQDDLTVLWLADKIETLLGKEDLAIEALELVEKILKQRK